MDPVDPSRPMLSDLDLGDPTEPIAIVRCGACFALTAVSLIGASVQPCELCSSAVEVSKGA